MLKTDGFDMETFKSHIQDLLSVLKTVKPGPSIGPVKDSCNFKENLPGRPTHTSYKESSKDMDRHSSVQIGTSRSSDAEEERHPRETSSNFHKEKN